MRVSGTSKCHDGRWWLLFGDAWTRYGRGGGNARNPGSDRGTRRRPAAEQQVIEAADIIRYLKGKTRAQVRAYCAQRGWRVSVVHQLERPHPWAPKATGDAL